MTRQPIGHHGPTHLPWGEDPIPSSSPAPFTSSYVLFSASISAVPSNTETVLDLSTIVVDTNEVTPPGAGVSWTGTNFAYDSGDPNLLHILTKGTYVYEALLWLGDGTTPTGTPFSAKIEETGLLYAHGLGGASAITQQYMDPGFVGGSPGANSNMNVFRHATYYFGNPGTLPAKRGLSYAHNYGSNIDIGAGFVVFRIAPP